MSKHLHLGKGPDAHVAHVETIRCHMAGVTASQYMGMDSPSPEQERSLAWWNRQSVEYRATFISSYESGEELGMWPATLSTLIPEGCYMGEG